MIEYAIYKGDTFLFIGTAEECATRMNVKPAFVKCLTCQLVRNVLKIVKIKTRL